MIEAIAPRRHKANMKKVVAVSLLLCGTLALWLFSFATSTSAQSGRSPAAGKRTTVINVIAQRIEDPNKPRSLLSGDAAKKEEDEKIIPKQVIDIYDGGVRQKKTQSQFYFSTPTVATTDPLTAVDSVLTTSSVTPRVRLGGNAGSMPWNAIGGLDCETGEIPVYSEQFQSWGCLDLQDEVVATVESIDLQLSADATFDGMTLSELIESQPLDLDPDTTIGGEQIALTGEDGGDVYVAWGRLGCRSPDTLIYSGFALSASSGARSNRSSTTWAARRSSPSVRKGSPSRRDASTSPACRSRTAGSCAGMRAAATRPSATRRAIPGWPTSGS